MSNKVYDSILIIDDHRMIGNGIQLLLDKQFKRFFIAKDGAEGVSLALQHFPDLIIIDYYLPDITGDLLVRTLKYRQPKAKVLTYSFTYSADVIIKMLQAGVNGYVIKSDNDKELIHAVGRLMDGDDYFCLEARNHIINRFATYSADSRKYMIANREFSAKELELVVLLCKQMSTKEASSHMHLSERTIEQYRSNIIRRIGAKNIGGVIKFALQNGIITIDEL